MNPVLSPEEMEALRQSTASSSASQPDPISLGARDRGLRRRLPGLQKRIDVLTEQLRVVLSKELHAPTLVEQLAPEVLGPKALQTCLAGWAAVAEVRSAKGMRTGLVGVGAVLALALVELAYGGDPATLATEAKRPRLTEVERQTLSSLLGEVAHSVTAAMGLGDAVVIDLPFPFQVDFDPNSSALLVGFEFALAGNKVRIDTLLLQDAVEQVDDSKTTPVDATQVASVMAQNLSGAQVEVRATLGTVEVPIEQVAGMRAGQVFWLNSTQAEPIPVHVEDRLAFLAQPIQRHGVLAVEIITRLS